MIISPPFLPSQAGHDIDSTNAGDSGRSDQNVCAAGMHECAPGNGAYPVSYNLGWHGGPHLIAPRAANGHTEPVRAIADGVVVYVRKTDASDKAALKYRGGRTDDGCVVIRHTTEIGEGENATVSFFSIYMHLQSVVGAVAPGKPVHRKDLLGVAGQIYGQSGQLHFELVCDDDNLHIDKRWGWLMTQHEALPAPLSPDDFATLKAHIEALAFWEDIQDKDRLPPVDECWHFPPRALIDHFR